MTKLLAIVFSLFYWSVSYGLLSYKPVNFQPETAKTVIVIHGCLQSAEIMYKSSGWNKKADENNLLILYPQVQKGSNPYDCWSWFLPYNHSPYVGQLGQIKKQAVREIKKNKIKDSQVFVMGISSGAATASGLLACYPDFFNAGALVAGPAYASAYSIFNVTTVLSDGPSASFYIPPCDLNSFQGRLLVVHGGEDEVVNSLHSEKTMETFLRGVSFEKSVEEKVENDLTFTEETYFINDTVLAQYVLVHDMGHAWPGYQGEEVQDYFLKKGPDVTQKAWELFKLD